MGRINQWSVRFLLAALLAAAVVGWGCKKQGAGERARVAKGQADVQILKNPRPEVPGASQKSTKPPQPVKKEIPKVNLPEQLAATCLVKVGDPMPEGELPDLTGKATPLRSLFGKKATVILFWSSESPYALQALRRLEMDVVKPFGDKGIRAIGINVKDEPEAARKAVEDAGVKLANLLDSQGACFARLATVPAKQLPRVYLVDSTGKILWFDVEYSGITRDSLKQAIEAVLGEGARD
jgi:peroxiredoxin